MSRLHASAQSFRKALTSVRKAFKANGVEVVDVSDQHKGWPVDKQQATFEYTLDYLDTAKFPVQFALCSAVANLINERIW